MKKLKFLGDSQKILKSFPSEVREEIGFALWVAEQGDTHAATKLFHGFGSGVYEIVSDHDKNAYRAVYVVKFVETVYVLHVFQKKSKKGISTPPRDINIIRKRLTELQIELKRRKPRDDDIKKTNTGKRRRDT